MYPATDFSHVCVCVCVGVCLCVRVWGSVGENKNENRDLQGPNHKIDTHTNKQTNKQNKTKQNKTRQKKTNRSGCGPFCRMPGEGKRKEARMISPGTAGLGPLRSAKGPASQRQGFRGLGALGSLNHLEVGWLVGVGFNH